MQHNPNKISPIWPVSKCFREKEKCAIHNFNGFPPTLHRFLYTCYPKQLITEKISRMKRFYLLIPIQQILKTDVASYKSM